MKGLLGDIIARLLRDDGKVSRRAIYKRSRREREANRARQARRRLRAGIDPALPRG